VTGLPLPITRSHIRNVNPLFLEPVAQPFLQRGQRLGQRVRPVILEGQPAVVQRPHHKTEALLVTDLDVPAPHPLGQGWEQLVDAGLLGGWLDQAGAAGFPDLA
jgi:hypothetical protein